MQEDPAPPSAGAADAIAFAHHYAGSETFLELFREGMALVEETAAYLDGPGRVEGRSLSRSAALSYSTESMRLTTRLMQMASWLLLQRAVNEGEISLAQACDEKLKLRLDGPLRLPHAPALQDLPQGLLSLIDRALRLEERVRHLDRAIYSPNAAKDAPNPVASTLNRLAEAFGPPPSP